jgi:hypothetical protein
LALLIFLNLVLAFSSEYLQPAFSYNSVHTFDLYRSQIAFKDRIALSGLSESKIKFIYTRINTTQKNDPREYKDFYMASPRVADYLDSLITLFLWNLSIAARIEPNADFSRINLDMKNDSPMILLGRNNAETQRLAEMLPKFLGAYSESDAQCYSDNNYPWCYIAFIK